ncbi:Protein BTN1 [Seminavis robusta]|uniref:Protein BTN1 n=1 Tax=Seminavis robusta TaxID=568900 RepID=A0A9N8H648_9STRA|nr:Protein BTN1 [Seminavis robusta]|eukprot:Sro90_g047290.1 Protein BTN1 (494) ;mRNA; r:33557-35038
MSPPTSTYAPIERDNDDHDDTSALGQQPADNAQNITSLAVAFWLLGLFNNSSYVIMIASAKTISEGGTALVFLANVVPSMCIKLTAPYWFDYVSYEHRMLVAFGCMVGSFAMVASSVVPSIQLLGVALGSAQSGLGEASLLAAAGKCDASGKCIAGFSSGTGLAGVFGFLWKFVWNEWIQLSMKTTLWLAQSLAVLYICIFWKSLRPFLTQAPPTTITATEEIEPLEMTTYQTPLSTTTTNRSMADTDSNAAEASSYKDDEIGMQCHPQDTEPSLESPPEIPDNGFVEDSHNNNNHSLQEPKPVHEMTVTERAQFVAMRLWPYIIPLFVVYAAEYSLQAGTWTAIGFPVDSEQARDEFYEFSNWMYQLGVFVSRSSGAFGPTAPVSILWLMPTLQALNVVFFAWVAAEHVWYNYTILIPCCFYVGLLGGGVYVHGYKRICADFVLVDQREFALAATSVAESMGIVCADLLGLFIQACLYRTNHIPGAVVSCPV